MSISKLIGARPGSIGKSFYYQSSSISKKSTGPFQLLLIGLLFSFCHLSMGQASVPTMTQDMVSKQVEMELDDWVQSQDFKSILQNHPEAKGILTLEISIYERGKVRSIFQVESTIEDVPFRNSIKNRVKEFKFDLKKMDKKTTQKVVYTFNID